MRNSTMTLREAHALWGECLSAMQALAQEFPCEECSGSGNANPGGCYLACEVCNGHGFWLPDEEDEE